MKILFTDLDNTLLNENSEVSDYTRSVIDRFIKAGNKLVLSSGRPLDSILQVKEQAGLDYKGIYINAYNGCLIFDCDSQKNICELRVPMELVDLIQNEAKEFNLHIQTYTLSSVVSPEEDEEIKFYRQKVKLPFIVSNRLSDALSEAPFKMLSIHLTDHEYLQKFEKHLNEKYGDKVTTLFSNEMYLEIFNKMGGKGSAVNYLCKYLGIPVENSYGAGDAQNDISMILAAGTGIAMKNAVDELKAVADVITDFDNTEDGLARYIETII